MARMIWIWQMQDSSQYIWNNELMITSGDGYTWAAGVENYLYGLHENNPGIRDIWSYGIVWLTALLMKITPFSLDTIILYMPTIISSLIVIPIILIAKLYHHSMWGFLSALLGSVAWSYYNRTMAGYYDTDMFSVMVPMFILYFLMKSTIELNLKELLYAGIVIAIYPFLYDQGQSIIYTMGLMYAFYMLFYYHEKKNIYHFIIIIFISLLPLPIEAPYNYIFKVLGLIIVYFILKKVSIKKVTLMIISGIFLVILIYFGNVFGIILHKVMSYLSSGVKVDGLHFYGVHQTIKEGRQVAFEMFANRILGSSIGVLISLIGYIVLVFKHREFILALPLVGIGIFALFGGLRFTIYVVPIAAMSAVYLFFIIGDYFQDKKIKYLFILFATTAITYPNIQHIIKHKVPTILHQKEVNDLVKLSKIADTKDYTLSWWDYGYPIWYYSKTSTIIDGGKHANDNFIISTIMQTSSSQLAANLSRLSVETYADLYSKYRKKNSSNVEKKLTILEKDNIYYKGSKGAITKKLFINKKKTDMNPNLLLNELESESFNLPKKSRDIYLYLPYRMLRIFSTIAIFGNIDLATGKEKRKITFIHTRKVSEIDGKIVLRKDIVLDTKSGEVTIKNEIKKIRNFITTENTKSANIKLNSKMYHIDGGYSVIYMKSYKKYVVMDTEIFNSMYVQMFILGKYDKELFDLVVSSEYSRIYKLKK